VKNLNNILLKQFTVKQFICSIFLRYPFLVIGNYQRTLSLHEISLPNDDKMIENLNEPLFTFKGHSGAVTKLKMNRSFLISYSIDELFIHQMDNSMKLCGKISISRDFDMELRDSYLLVSPQHSNLSVQIYDCISCAPLYSFVHENLKVSWFVSNAPLAIIKVHNLNFSIVFLRENIFEIKGSFDVDYNVWANFSFHPFFVIGITTNWIYFYKTSNLIKGGKVGYFKRIDNTSTRVLDIKIPYVEIDKSRSLDVMLEVHYHGRLPYLTKRNF
jgi:hypothetical protein